MNKNEMMWDIAAIIHLDYPINLIHNKDGRSLSDCSRRYQTKLRKIAKEILENYA